MSVNLTMSKHCSVMSFRRINEIDATCMRKTEKQIRAHPHIWLGNKSKDAAHVRVDTSYKIGSAHRPRLGGK